MTIALGNLTCVRDRLRCELFDSVLPFWEQHAFDPAGGLNTCIDDEGRVISRDKWLWSQWRAVWVFARVFRLTRDERWLNYARKTMDFCIRVGWDNSEHGWVLRVDGDGGVLDGYQSVYVDGFAIYGLTELLRGVPNDARAIEWARRTADSVLHRLGDPHDRIPHFPYPVPAGMRVHGIPMIFSLSFWELGQVLQDSRYQAAALEMSDEIFSSFYRADRDLILERINTDGSESAPPLGTAVVPGHAIEDMWFQMHIARDRSDQPRIAHCVYMIRRHLELGWDEEFGGILLAVDANGSADVGWKFSDTKLWWPHTESMYALLLAYEYSRQPWCLEWFERVYEYSLAKFPIATGEWRQKLDRTGQPLGATVALPVKDPFHLPRALILCGEVLDRLLSDRQTNSERETQ